MQVDAALISRLEKLARLQLTPDQREHFARDLERILDMVDQLQSADVDGVEPLVYLSSADEPFREDRINGQLPTNTALANAPQHDGQFFRVPKVIPD